MSARDLLAAATPRPWVINDRREMRDLSDADVTLIVVAVNEYEALLAAEASLRAVADFLAGSYRDHAKDALARLDALRSET